MMNRQFILIITPSGEWVLRQNRPAKLNESWSKSLPT